MNLHLFPQNLPDSKGYLCRQLRSEALSNRYSLRLRLFRLTQPPDNFPPKLEVLSMSYSDEQLPLGHRILKSSTRRFVA